MSISRNNVFPPIVNSSISAFSINSDSIIVNYSLPMTMNSSYIKHIDIRIVQQNNNKTVANTDIYYDGIIYKPFIVDENFITIDNKDVKKINGNELGWTANTYYKIQIRFGYGELFNYEYLENEFDKQGEYYRWKKEQIKLNNFSEWSNVIVTKAIEEPTVDLLNNLKGNIEQFPDSILKISNNIESSRFPRFYGGYKNTSDEPLDKYRFRLYEGFVSKELKENYQEPLLSSGWLQYNGDNKHENTEYTALVDYAFNKPLNVLSPKYYTVIFDTISKNEYQKSSNLYTFTVSEGVLDELTNLTLVVKDNSHSGYYRDYFMGTHKEIFNSYKNLFGLPKEATYLKADGFNIIYSEKDVKSSIYNKKIQSFNKQPIVLNKIGVSDFKIPSSIYKNSSLLLSLDCMNEENKIEHYNILLNEEEKDYEFQNNTIVLKSPILNVISGNAYFIWKQDKKILTQEQRIKSVSSFEENVRSDENGTLEIYLKNSKIFTEVEKIDDVTGISNYEIVETYKPLDGIYYLIRSDEKSNFTEWEDLAKFDFYNETDFDNQLTMLYEDFTVESGIKYKYALQKESVKGYRSPPRFEFEDFESSPSHCSNFQYTYIYANGVQVRLDLDVKIQQFKHTRLFQKQDSLNSKYPVILRNGLANYAEFSLGGKITLHSDKDNSFFMRDEEYDNISGQWNGGYKFNKNDIVISADKYMNNASRVKYYPPNITLTEQHELNSQNLDDEINDKSYPSINGGQINTKDNYYAEGENIDNKNIDYEGVLIKVLENKDYSMFNTNHTDNNIFMERIYRQYVEQFLNDGEYKLYKSPTEGNMIVTLVNVSLTPNQQLNRLIADFNSTVYEVADNTVKNIKLYDINPLDVITNNMYLATGERAGKYKTTTGQIRGVFDGQYSKFITIEEEIFNILKEDKNNLFLENYFFEVFETYDTSSKYNFYNSYEEFKKEIKNKYPSININEYDTSDQVVLKINQSECGIIVKKQYQSCQKLPLEIINKIYEQKLKKFFSGNNNSLSNNLNSQEDIIRKDYEKRIKTLNSLLNTNINLSEKEKAKNSEILSKIKLLEKARDIEIEMLGKELTKIKSQATSNSIDFTLQNNYFWNEEYDNLVNWIKLQEEKIIDNERIYEVKDITSITVELYPKHDIEQELINLKQNTYDTLKHKLTQQLLIAQYELLLKQYELSQSNPIILILNKDEKSNQSGQEITILPGRTYHLEGQKINSIHLKYSRPILINYTAILEEKDYTDNITLSKKEILNIGQVSGVFTNNENIFNNYAFNAEYERKINQLQDSIKYLTDDNKKSSIQKEIDLLREKRNQLLQNENKNLIFSEDTDLNYSLYNSLNILDVIREQVKTRIYDISNKNNKINSYNVLEEKIKDFLENYVNKPYEEQIQRAKEIYVEFKPLWKINKNKNTDIWINAKNRYVIYRFEGLESLNIETQSNTEIKFNTRDYYQSLGGIILEDDGNESRVIVGGTNKFILQVDENDTVNQLEYINDCRFSQPAYAIVNYRAIVSLEIKGEA